MDMTHLLYVVGLPAGVMGIVLALAILLPPLRRRPTLTDCALALCLPGAAFLSFVLEKGMIVPGGDGWQQRLITPWVLLGAMVLGLVVAMFGRGRWRGFVTVCVAGIAGVAVALWLELPKLDAAGQRVTMGVVFAVAVLAFAGATATGRGVVFHVAAWAATAAAALTLLADGQLTLGASAGAMAACAAVAAVLLAILPGSAPPNRVGLGAATGLSVAIVIVLLVGQVWDTRGFTSEGIAAWRWWLPLAGVGALLLLPGSVSSARKSTRASAGTLWGTLLALVVVIAPAVASIVLALGELSAMNATGS